jgi:hypothetical protein
MPDFLSAVNAVIEWAKAPVKTMFILCSMSAFALFAPTRWEDAMQIHGLVRDHFGLLYIVFGFSALYLVFTGVQNISRLVIVPLKKYYAHRKFAALFENLSDSEVDILMRYIISGKTMIHYPPDHLTGPLESTLLELDTKGILENEGMSGDFWTALHGYSLTPQANTYLRDAKVKRMLHNRHIAAKAGHV